MISFLESRFFCCVLFLIMCTIYYACGSYCMHQKGESGFVIAVSIMLLQLNLLFFVCLLISFLIFPCFIKCVGTCMYNVLKGGRGLGVIRYHIAHERYVVHIQTHMLLDIVI
ncbi:unnamed protein product [Musa textilis]